MCCFNEDISVNRLLEGIEIFIQTWHFSCIVYQNLIYDFYQGLTCNSKR